MKILLTNNSTAFSQIIKGTQAQLLWNTKIGIGIYYNHLYARSVIYPDRKSG